MNGDTYLRLFQYPVDDLFISVLESDSRATRESDDLQGYWQWGSWESSCFWHGVDVLDLADFSQSFEGGTIALYNLSLCRQASRRDELQSEDCSSSHPME